jgi:hypothetical protein
MRAEKTCQEPFHYRRMRTITEIARQIDKNLRHRLREAPG